jgi:hypothetical protein
VEPETVEPEPVEPETVEPENSGPETVEPEPERRKRGRPRKTDTPTDSGLEIGLATELGELSSKRSEPLKVTLESATPESTEKKEPEPKKEQPKSEPKKIGRPRKDSKETKPKKSSLAQSESRKKFAALIVETESNLIPVLVTFIRPYDPERVNELMKPQFQGCKEILISAWYDVLDYYNVDVQPLLGLLIIHTAVIAGPVLQLEKEHKQKKGNA